jgi:hypothetical protein
LKLPNADRAVVEISKLRSYSLSPTHDIGKHKARVFQAALGITIDDAEWLRKQLLRAAIEGETIEGRMSPFGQMYVLDAVIKRGNLSALVRTTWIVEHGTDFPRLTSCYVK